MQEKVANVITAGIFCFLCDVFLGRTQLHAASWEWARISVQHWGTSIPLCRLCGACVSLKTVDSLMGFAQHEQLECGPMPNVMAALPNIVSWRPLLNATKFG